MKYPGSSVSSASSVFALPAATVVLGNKTLAVQPFHKSNGRSEATMKKLSVLAAAAVVMPAQ